MEREITLHLIGCSTPSCAKGAMPPVPTPVFVDDDGSTWMVGSVGGELRIAPFPPDPAHESWDWASAHTDADLKVLPSHNDVEAGPAASSLASAIEGARSLEDAVSVAGAMHGDVGAWLGRSCIEPEAIERTLRAIRDSLEPSVIRDSMRSAMNASARTSPIAIDTRVPIVHSMLSIGSAALGRMLALAGEGSEAGS